eukprot:366209-Chlamydomonas_euryale.AAC.10
MQDIRDILLGLLLLSKVLTCCVLCVLCRSSPSSLRPTMPCICGGDDQVVAPRRQVKQSVAEAADEVENRGVTIETRGATGVSTAAVRDRKKTPYAKPYRMKDTRNKDQDKDARPPSRIVKPKKLRNRVDTEDMPSEWNLHAYVFVPDLVRGMNKAMGVLACIWAPIHATNVMQFTKGLSTMPTMRTLMAKCCMHRAVARCTPQVTGTRPLRSALSSSLMRRWSSSLCTAMQVRSRNGQFELPGGSIPGASMQGAMVCTW